MDFVIWTKEMGIRCTDLMSMIKCSPAKAHRILTGKRKPQDEDYRTLFFESDGVITPNSFHPISKWEKELLKIKRHQSPASDS